VLKGGARPAGRRGELAALTKEAHEIVRAMDARNRLRFKEDRQALELWVSARTVLGSPTGGVERGGAVGAGAGHERDAGCGRRCETRGMNRGRRPGSWTGEPPPRDRDFRRRLSFHG